MPMCLHSQGLDVEPTGVRTSSARMCSSRATSPHRKAGARACEHLLRTRTCLSSAWSGKSIVAVAGEEPERGRHEHGGMVRRSCRRLSHSPLTHS